MGWPLRTVAVALGTGALAVAVLQAPSTGAEVGERAAYPQPKAGSWKFKDPFGDSKGTLVVKAGTKGKSPKVKRIRITVTQQDNGADCPAPGTVLKVKGSFPLRKAPKWADDDFRNEHAWASAKKDKKYDDEFPNLLGMKPRKAKVKVSGETRNAVLALSFVKASARKPHLLDFSMRLLTPGSTSTSDGWCLFSYDDGKPGK